MVDTTDVSLEAGDNDTPALTMGEMGSPGLFTLGGQVLEECSRELRWPEAINTYKRMAKDGAIAPALELVEMMIARVPWTVKVPEGYEDKLKDHANFVRQCIADMEHDFQTFIKQAVSFNRYGFAITEKVYRYRFKANGSKYDDGLVGIKKLPIRSQDTVEGWYWKNQGRDIAGFYQRICNPGNASYVGWDFVQTADNENTLKKIPRKKFMLFRNNPLKNSPVGTSPLNGAWQAWKYKQAYQESEAIAVAQDSNGFKVLYIPPEYMTEDASEDKKEAYEEYKRILANMHQAKQSGVILPLLTDQEGNRMFSLEFQSITGQKSYDTNAIINRYTSEILTALFADFLSLGSNGSGSFSLAESKISVVEMAIQSKLDEIKAQLNHDLIRQLFELNGWDTDVMPYLDYGAVSAESLDELGKFVQRVSAVGMLPKAPEVVNWIMQQADIPYRVDNKLTANELSEQLTPETSNSGAGMAEGMPNGTGSSNGSGGDSSTSNSENT